VITSVDKWGYVQVQIIQCQILKINAILDRNEENSHLAVREMGKIPGDLRWLQLMSRNSQY
jgi:hypothetical protein